jgi:pyruvate/2-oxoglutarate dehydrogenase complex dihydrolipoamide acyltransferase (E2) component
MEVRMPKLGMEMTEGLLSRWLVDDGASVEQGQAIYEIETEKVESEIPAAASGVLRQIGKAGETYDVGTLLAQLET